MSIKTNYCPFVFLLLVNLLSLSSCIDVIDFDKENIANQHFVIQAKLANSSPPVVTAFVSFLFEKSGITSPATHVGAKVFLLNEEDKTWELKKVNPGAYRLTLSADLDFTLSADKAYRIRVTTPEGFLYESTPQYLPVKSNILNVRSKIFIKESIFMIDNLEVKKEFPKLIVNADIPAKLSGESKRPFYRYEVLKASKNCPPLVDPCLTPIFVERKQNIINTNDYQGDVIFDFPISETPIDCKFCKNTELFVLQESIDEQAYDYFRQINETIHFTGNMFEPTPGNLITNFKNINKPDENVYGYFYISQEDTISLKIPVSKYQEYTPCHCGCRGC